MITVKKIIGGIIGLVVADLVAYGANLGNKHVAAGNEATAASNGGLYTM